MTDNQYYSILVLLAGILTRVTNTRIGDVVGAIAIGCLGALIAINLVAQHQRKKRRIKEAEQTIIELLLPTKPKKKDTTT